MVAVVTEDSVTGTGASWAQVNYYSTGTFLSGAGKDWHSESNPVTDMEYNHVARVIAGDQYIGEPGSLPTTVSAGSTQSHQYTVALDPSWDVSKISVVGMLVSPSGEIDNAGKSNEGFVGISEVEESNFSISVYPNPASDLVNLKLVLNESSEVTIEVVNMLGASFESIKKQNLSVGQHYSELPQHRRFGYNGRKRNAPYFWKNEPFRQNKIMGHLHYD